MNWGSATRAKASKVTERVATTNANLRRLALAVILADQVAAGRIPSELSISEYRTAVAEARRTETGS